MTAVGGSSAPELSQRRKTVAEVIGNGRSALEISPMSFDEAIGRSSRGRPVQRG